MKAICPQNPKHNRFITTAHVCQEWIVDSEGNFIEEACACLEVTHDPHPQNIWTCTECHSEAIVE
jgi:hypothetical protein